MSSGANGSCVPAWGCSSLRLLKKGLRDGQVNPVLFDVESPRMRRFCPCSFLLWLLVLFGFSNFPLSSEAKSAISRMWLAVMD